MATECPPLSSPWQATFAALLGGPVAGLWVVAENFKIIGWETKARRARVAIPLVLIALLAFSIYGPEIKSGAVLGGICAGAIRQYALISYGNTYKRHLEEGGLRASHRRWIVAGLIGLIVTFGAAFAYIYGMAAVVPELLPRRFFSGA